jgi:hypothetical protein
MQPVKRATIEDREQEIFRYLKQPERVQAGATVREIWEAVPERVGARNSIVGAELRIRRRGNRTELFG